MSNCATGGARPTSRRCLTSMVGQMVVLRRMMLGVESIGRAVMDRVDMVMDWDWGRGVVVGVLEKRMERDLAVGVGGIEIGLGWGLD